MNQIAKVERVSLDAQSFVEKLPDWLPDPIKRYVHYAISESFPEDFSVEAAVAFSDKIVSIAKDERLRPLWGELLKRKGSSFLRPAVKENVKQYYGIFSIDDNIALQEGAIFLVFKTIFEAILYPKQRTFYTSDEFSNHLSFIKTHIESLEREAYSVRRLTEDWAPFTRLLEQRIEYWTRYRQRLLEMKPIFVVEKNRKNRDALSVALLFSLTMRKLFASPLWNQAIVVGEIATGQRATVAQLRDLSQHMLDASMDLQGGFPDPGCPAI